MTGYTAYHPVPDRLPPRRFLRADFAVETVSEKLIVEIKARRDLETDTVKIKSRAVATWIGYANRHAAENAGKSWRYLLVPHDRMTESASLAGLTGSFSQPAIDPE